MGECWHEQKCRLLNLGSDLIIPSDNATEFKVHALFTGTHLALDNTWFCNLTLYLRSSANQYQRELGLPELSTAGAQPHRPPPQTAALRSVHCPCSFLSWQFLHALDEDHCLTTATPGSSGKCEFWGTSSEKWGAQRSRTDTSEIFPYLLKDVIQWKVENSAMYVWRKRDCI